MRNVLAGLTWVALACCLIACEDGGGNGGAERGGTTTCEPFVACGGDITGMWTIQDACADDIAAVLGTVIDEPQCGDLIRNHTLSVSGDYTFAADGTVSYAGTTQLQLQFTWTPSCLAAINDGRPVNVPATCGNISDKYENEPQYEGGSCLFDGTSCNCSVTSRIERMGTATYQVSGTQILTPGDAPAAYCVSGDTLTMLEHGEHGDAVITFTR